MLRMRRRAIVRTAVGAAVVGGTAAAVGSAVNHHYQQKDAQQNAQQQAMYNQQQGAYAQQPQVVYVQQPAPQPLPAARVPALAAPANDMTVQLQQLAQLHASGVLSDAEFAAAKQKLLAG